MIIEYLIFIFTVIIIIASSILFAYNLRNRWDYSANTFQWRFPVHELIPIPYNVVLDQHVHTTLKGGNLSLVQNIQWHIANGFNAMVLSEHNAFNDHAVLRDIQIKYQNQIILIQGMEWTTERIHLNFIDIKGWNEKIPKNPTDEEIRYAIQSAHNGGAMVVVNHPKSQRAKAPNFPSLDQLLSWGVDYIEVQGQDYYDLEAVDFCTKKGLGMISGTDIHFPIPVNGWTVMNATEFSLDAILEELHKKRTHVIYNQQGSPDYTVRKIPIKSQRWTIFMFIGQLFSQTNHSRLEIKWGRLGSVLLLLSGLFFIAEFIGLILQ